MENEQLVVVRNQIAQAKNINELFEIKKFEENFITNCAATTGQTREKASMIWEREKLMFLQQIADNKALQDCSNFSLYSAFISLGASGQSQADGCAYIVPKGKKASFQMGWKGRINQMYEIPEIKWVNQPEIVLENDEFEFEKGSNPRVVKHVPSGDKITAENIVAVYMTIDMVIAKKLVTKTYLTEGHEVKNIRDKYSESYKSWKKKKDSGKLESWMDEPMWVSSPGQAFRKTLVKRVWQYLPKTKRLLEMDAYLSQSTTQSPDVETGESYVEMGEAMEDDYAQVVNDDGTTDQVNRETGEVETGVVEQYQPTINIEDL